MKAMETATFQFTDSRTTVDASLACPRCLHAVAWEPVGAGAQPAVECRCRHCGHERVVELTGAQMLRLTIDDGDDDDDAWVADRPGRATWRQVLQLL
jgi:DNA-directed RNA polymerase subunit RPC12/RpoP